MIRLETYLNEFKEQYLSSKENQLIVISGPKQSGKTTLSMMIIDYLNQNNSLTVVKATINEIKENLTDLKTENIYLVEHREKLALDDLNIITAYCKEHQVIVIINTYTNIIDDSVISINLKNMNKTDLKQIFMELLADNNEMIDEQTLDYVNKYIMLVYHQEDVTGSIIEELFKKMQIKRMDKQKNIFDVTCLPIEVKEKVDSYLEKERNKSQLLKQVLKEVSTMVRNEPLQEYLDSFLLRKKISQEMKQHNLNDGIDPILVIAGNVCSGRKEAINIIAKVYYAINLIFDEDFIKADYQHLESDCYRGYTLNKLVVLDCSNIIVDNKIVQILLKYYERGTKIILKMTPESLTLWSNFDPGFTRRCKIINLPDYNSKQLYQVFEKICNQNRIIISSNAGAAIQTIFALDEKENKIKEGNELIARSWFEKINLQRYRRNNIPYYEILLEDVLKAIKTM